MQVDRRVTLDRYWEDIQWLVLIAKLRLGSSPSPRILRYWDILRPMTLENFFGNSGVVITSLIRFGSMRSVPSRPMTSIATMISKRGVSFGESPAKVHGIDLALIVASPTLFTRGKVDRRRAQLEESVGRYLDQLDTADRHERRRSLR
jgi:hypothetical protein